MTAKSEKYVLKKMHSRLVKYIFETFQYFDL